MIHTSSNITPDGFAGLNSIALEAPIGALESQHRESILKMPQQITH